MTRDELRAQIDTLEALHGVEGAIEDVTNVEFEGRDHLINVTFADREKAPIAFAHGIPQSVALAGLEAMKQALERQLSGALARAQEREPA